ncbi:MAG: putative rane protein, partial [Oscillospiraceae bacterium]|nr:putative rane protein [Oscillospiraceae bacterium]
NSRLYDITTDPELEKSYRLYPHKKANWLNPHNFILADMLDGGLVKTIAGIAVLLMLFGTIINMMRKNIGRVLISFLMFGLVVCNNLISSPFGFLYDKFFWITVLFLIMERLVQQKELAE